MNSWIALAKSIGFEEAVVIPPGILQPRQDVRAMCASDLCNAYEKNWTCPPYCGTLEECGSRIAGSSHCLLVQTVGKTEKLIDTKAYRETEHMHLQRFYRLAREVRAVHPGALCLGSGGCRICGRCAYPQPCRFPEEACSSMEAYGLFVTQVCRDAGIAYHHGEKTITYTACILF